MEELLSKVKQNIILNHDEDDVLLSGFINVVYFYGVENFYDFWMRLLFDIENNMFRVHLVWEVHFCSNSKINYN